MTTLYVAGPMTGLPDFNYPAFYEAEAALLVAGYDVENPARNQVEGTASWLAYMRMSLVQIAKVDGIALLPGWGDSRGARIEQELGVKLGLPVKYVEAWISGAAVSRYCEGCCVARTAYYPIPCDTCPGYAPRAKEAS